MESSLVISLGQIDDLLRKPNGKTNLLKLCGPGMINLTTLKKLGFSIPQQFSITTEAYKKFVAAGHEVTESVWKEVLASLHELEVKTGKQFGGEHPLFLSSHCVPPDQGVLNIGMNDYTARMLENELQNRGIVYDGYRRLIRGYGVNVLQIPEFEFDNILIEYRISRNLGQLTQFTPLDWIQVTKLYKGLIVRFSHRPFPQDPLTQLRDIVTASFNNFYSEDYALYRAEIHSGPELKPSINIGEMSFGSSAVFSTHNLSTGEQTPEGIFAPSCYLDDLVNENLPILPITELSEWPNLEAKIPEILKAFKEPVTIQLVVDKKGIQVVTSFPACFSGLARFRAACQTVESGVTTQKEILNTLIPAQFGVLLRPATKSKPKTPLCVGAAGAYGTASGVLCVDPEECIRLQHEGKNAILVKPTITTSDIAAVRAAVAVVTIEGGNYSWMANTCRQMAKTAAIGCKNLVIDGEKRVVECNGISCNFGDEITVDLGDVYQTPLATLPVEGIDSQDAATVLSWADDVRSQKFAVFSAAHSIDQTKLAAAAGADGIGSLAIDSIVRDCGASEALVNYVLSLNDRSPTFASMTTSSTSLPNLNANINSAMTGGINGGINAGMNGINAGMNGINPGMNGMNPGNNSGVTAINPNGSVMGVGSNLSFDKSSMELRTRLASGCTDFLVGAGNQNVDISLLAQPLAAFLPDLENLVVEIAELETKREFAGNFTAAQEEELQAKSSALRTVQQVRDANPMLGLRGARLSVAAEGLFGLQIRAIVEGLRGARNKGADPKVRVIVPGVCDWKEVLRLEKEFKAICQEVEEGLVLGVTFEGPRSCMACDRIPEVAGFALIDAEALHERMWGMCEQDAAATFLRQYLDWGILEAAPFDQIDIAGAGEMIKRAAEGMKAKEGFPLGIVVGRALDKSLVRFCYALGISSLTVEPNMVPVARLCAAQAILSTE